MVSPPGLSRLELTRAGASESYSSRETHPRREESLWESSKVLLGRSLLPPLGGRQWNCSQLAPHWQTAPESELSRGTSRCPKTGISKESQANKGSRDVSAQLKLAALVPFYFSRVPHSNSFLIRLKECFNIVTTLLHLRIDSLNHLLWLMLTMNQLFIYHFLHGQFI